MKVEIDPSGYLSIGRAGLMKPQLCPHSESGRCGDWCPRFGEPVSLAGSVSRDLSKLSMCQGLLLTGEITDKRART